MRRVLICGWGEDGRRWVGRSMELYCDPSVRFGGQEVGGIRIKAMSDIPRRIEVALTATRGKKALHIIEVLTVNAPPDYSAAIAGLEKTAAEQGAAALEAAWKALKPADRKAIGPDELARLKSITTLKNEPVA